MIESAAANAPRAALRWLLAEAITDGPHESPEFVEDGVPFLSVDSIVNSEINFDGCRRIRVDDHHRYSRKLKPRRGDVLITKAASVGKVALVRESIDFNVWSPIAVIRPDASILSAEFLWQYLRTSVAQRYLQLGSTSNTQQNISMRDLGSLPVPVIPVEHQVDICSQLRDNGNEAVILAVLESVRLLQEHRQALITAAVSRELDIPGMAA